MEVPLRTAYGQNGRYGMQPKARQSSRAGAANQNQNKNSWTLERERGTRERSGIGGEREDDRRELIMGHEDELTTEELQEILNEEHQETHRNVSPSEKEEDERGPMPTSAIKDLLKKWEDVRAMVLEWHPNQADVSRVGDRYNDNAINYFRKILKKREPQSTLDMFFNAPKAKNEKDRLICKTIWSPERINRFYIEVYGESMIGSRTIRIASIVLERIMFVNRSPTVLYFNTKATIYAFNLLWATDVYKRLAQPKHKISRRMYTSF
ncbi:uncharacterized protein TNCV_188861 [Trichonephila clavipes]|nr:uncharacterized protein TNCV_188861 [Trichonephila clavipes]